MFRDTNTASGHSSSATRARLNGGLPQLLDFFAGSGLVSEALGPFFNLVWANDIDPKKATVFCANHPSDVFHLGPIEQMRGSDVPCGTLSWASFPCQDLSLAGNLRGIGAARSGLVWQWLRVMDEMTIRPPIVVAENVSGLVSADKGEHYRMLHQALVLRGYRVGALELDAERWVPQSRPRIFVVGVLPTVETKGHEAQCPGWPHTPAIQKAAKGLDSWIWWNLPEPPMRTLALEQMVEVDTAPAEPQWSAHNMSLVPPRHLKRLREAVAAGRTVFPGYRRIRDGRQVLELRFDGIAGCLRTAEGGSSWQFLVLRRNGGFGARRLTVREAARLMGVPDDYCIPGSRNQAYKALGDAVAVPAVRYLGQHLLAPLANRIAAEVRA
ncbi:MAG: DNA cytosine methyltransferase [Dehalococcoidia bacterium]|nr:DNA cytosine methyltransferase [Dehalococcoidia bacterium]